MIFDVKNGNPVDAEALRVDFQRGWPAVLKTAETMAQSTIPSERIAAAQAAAEELHIKFGQAHTEGVEELVPL